MSRFDTTRWSVVLGAQGTGEDARAALDLLCRTYRPPVLAYIRSRGYGSDVAEDLTQSFFTKFIERPQQFGADPARGRFRAFLLMAIKRFLIKSAQAVGRVKRGGRIQFESIESDTDDTDEPRAVDGSPEEAFDRAWAFVVIESALQRLRQEACHAGKEEFFDQLQDFLIEAPDDDDYERIAAMLNLRRNTLAVSVHRLRQRLRTLVHEEVAQTASDPASFETEIRELRYALGAAIH